MKDNFIIISNVNYVSKWVSKTRQFYLTIEITSSVNKIIKIWDFQQIYLKGTGNPFLNAILQLSLISNLLKNNFYVNKSFQLLLGISFSVVNRD